ncbi:hypothetical protein Esti_001798 [Eimeria stiedai]
MGFSQIVRQLAILSLSHFPCCFLICFHSHVEGASVTAQYINPDKLKGGSTLHEPPNVTDIPNPYRDTENSLPHQLLPSGTLLRLHNDCNGAESLAFPRAGPWQHASGCDVHLEQIESHNNWKRSQLRLFSTADFPEVTGVALWGHEGTHSIESNSKDEGCYFYSLEPEDGWWCGKDSSKQIRRRNITGALTSLFREPASWSHSVKDIWERRGIRLGSSPRMRYGTLFVAEFDGHGRRLWVKPLANDAALFFGNVPTVVIEGGAIPDARGDVERHYAVTVTRERWVAKEGKTAIFPHCEIIIMTAKGDREEADLPGKECESCQYSAASLHPVTHTWASLCVNATIPNLGIKINGLLFVDSTQRYGADRVDIKSLGPFLSYLKDTSGRLIPAAEGHWVLIWKETSWQVSQIEGLMAMTATVKAAVWQQNQGCLGILGEPTSLIGPLMELRLRNVDALALSHETALVTAIDQLSGEALVVAVDLSKVRDEGSVGKIDAALRNEPLFERLYRRVPASHQSDVALLPEQSTRSLLSSGPARQLPNWQLLDMLQAMWMTKNETPEDCRGQWEASSSTCPSFCLQQQTFRSTTNVNACPWGPTDFRLVHCDGGDCPNWRAAASLFVKGAWTDVTPLLDKNLSTSLKLNLASDSLTLRLVQPVDIEEIVVYIKPIHVSLKLNILDVENKYVYSSVISFAAPDTLADARAEQAWVTRNILLRRVSAFEIKADPPTNVDLVSAAEWSVDLLELSLRSTPSPPCAGGGFSSEEAGCETTESQPHSLEELDCKGEWGDWSVCDQNCTRKRLFKILSPPRRGGKPCVSYAVEQCAGTSLT